jgi:hypothetical protein
MARPLQVEYPGGSLSHVAVRGNARHAIVLDDADRETLLVCLGDLRMPWAGICQASYLAQDHDHLLVRTWNGTAPRGGR